MYKSVPNVQKCICIVYIFQLSLYFAYHCWWLGMYSTVEYHVYIVHPSVLKETLESYHSCFLRLQNILSFGRTLTMLAMWSQMSRGTPNSSVVSSAM